MPIVYNFIRLLFNLLSLAILARVILSWFNVNPFHPVVSFLDAITEPILGPLRRVIPPIGMIDITPIVALVLLQVVETILLSLVQSI
jgi:YggT family protein